MNDNDQRVPFEDTLIRRLLQENIALRHSNAQWKTAYDQMHSAYLQMVDAYEAQNNAFESARPFVDAEKRASTHGLAAEIKAAQAEYTKPVPDRDTLIDPEVPHPQRRGMIRALSAVAHYVEARHGLLAEMLHVLRYALIDLEQGRNNPLFSPRPKGSGARGTPLRRDVHMAQLAAAVTCLVRSGMSEADAVRACAQYRQGLTADKLKRWHDHLTDRPQMIQEHYWHCVGKQRSVAEGMRFDGDCGSLDEIDSKAARAAAIQILWAVANTLE